MGIFSNNESDKKISNTASNNSKVNITQSNYKLESGSTDTSTSKAATTVVEEINFNNMGSSKASFDTTSSSSTGRSASSGRRQSNISVPGEKAYAGEKYSFDDINITEDDINISNSQNIEYRFVDDYMKEYADLNGDGSVTDDDVKFLIEGINSRYKDDMFDINGDGRVTIEDAKAIKRYIMGARNPFASESLQYDTYMDDLMFENADINSDGLINSNDLELFQNLLTQGNTDGIIDLDGDGAINIMDATILQKYLNGDDVSEMVDSNLRASYTQEEKERRNYPYKVIKEKLDSDLSDIELKLSTIGLSDADKTYYQDKKEKITGILEKIEDDDTDSLNIDNIWGHIYDLFNDGKYELDNLIIDDDERRLFEGLDETIEQYTKEIDKMEESLKNVVPYGVAHGWDSTYTSMYYNQLKGDIDKKKEERSTLERQAYNLKETIIKRPWYSILETEGYSNWLSNQSYDKYPKPVKKVTSKFAGPNVGNIEHVEYQGGQEKFYLSYDYMSDEQVNLYGYIYETQGLEEAEKYLDGIQDEINQVKGTEAAHVFLDDLDYEDNGRLKDNLKNMFCAGGQGLYDGIASFVDGIEKALSNGDVLSAEDYKKALILQTLKEKSNVLDDIYSGSSAIGNVILPMAISALTSAVATPVAGKIVGSVLMGISAYGNAKVQAKASGSSTVASVLYGIASGTSESVTEYFLGAIPGIGKETSSYLASILKEGGQEFIQEYLDAGYRAVLLGEKIDLTELNEQAFNSFIMGMVVSSILNGGQRTFALTVGGIQYLIDSKKVETAIKAGEVVSAENIGDYVVTKDTSIDSIMEKHHVSEEIATIMYENNVNQETATIMNKLNVDADRALEIISDAKKYSKLGKAKRTDMVKSMSDSEISELLSYFDLKNKKRLFSDVILKLDTSQMQSLLEGDGYSNQMLQRISNTITEAFDKYGTKGFNADFKKIAKNYMDTHDVPQMKSFIDAIHADGWYSKTENCADGKIEAWAMLQCLQAQKLASNPDVDFLNTVNKAYASNHKDASGNLDNKQFTNAIDAYFAVLNDCREPRKVLADEGWKCQNKAAYLKDHPGETVWTQKQVDQYYAEYKWLSDLTVEIAKKNGCDPSKVKQFSSMQSSDYFITVNSDVGRQGFISTEVDGGMAGCDAYEVDSWIMSTMESLMASGADPKDMEKSFIDKYVTYASLKRSQWSTINRAVVTDASGLVVPTDGLSSNCFDLDWALGGETLGMNSEYFIQHGKVKDSSKVSDGVTTYTAETNYDGSQSTYHVTYAYGLNGMLEEMYNSGRLNDAQKTKVASWYKRMNGTDIPSR